MPRNVGTYFNGKHIIHPGAWSKIDARALDVLGGPSARKIVFLGTSEGGEPGKVHWFSSPADAKAVLRGGDLLKAGELAWNPSNDGVGAGMIGFIRVQNATQAQLVQGNMVIKSKDYGNWTNQIQVKLEDGTTPGSKKLTVYHWKDDVKEIYDDLGVIFDIQYTGSEPYASLTITTDPTTGKANRLSIKVGQDQATATEVLAYDLGEGMWYDVLRLVNDINEHVDFEASMKPTGDKNITTDALDPVTNVDIKSQKYDVLAMKGDILYQTRVSNLIEISFTDTGSFPENFDYTFLSGGSDGTVPSSWIQFFELLRGEGAYLVVPLTTDRAIQAECNNFINQIAEDRIYMMGFYGGDIGESIDEIIGRAVAFNSFRAVVAYPSIQILDSNGQIVTLPGYMTAALIAGRTAGKVVGDPITLDFVNIVGLDRILKPSEIDRLLQAGVTPLEFVRQSSRAGYRIVQGITTHQVDSNPSFREISMRIIADTLSSELVEILENKFVGGKGTISTVALIKNEVQSFLDQKVREEVLVEYDPNSVQVRLEGETVYIEYACQPVGALNYILITAKYYQNPISA